MQNVTSDSQPSLAAYWMATIHQSDNEFWGELGAVAIFSKTSSIASKCGQTMAMTRHMSSSV